MKETAKNKYNWIMGYMLNESYKLIFNFGEIETNWFNPSNYI